ncbi:AGAP008760-PA [Anopheles gambiae str. PEST]|uniref:AGAP008760-PA n=1 Tax=Anopheles gambiae TaxID=7165 RepID=Q7Q877_ANOGA|nr:AGAP008760-PA [Anopheles gambiae str. PEST]
MGGGDLNTKKSWHPNTMKNQERVWKAEQQEAAEKKRLTELRREIDEERNREELKSIGQKSGILPGDEGDKKLEWMYRGPSQLVNREEYLLGRTIDKTFEELDAQEKTANSTFGVAQPKNHVEHECIPFSIRQHKDVLSSDQVDLARKMMEDPLMLIKQREMESRQKILQNPVKLKELHRLLKGDRSLKQSEGKKNKKKDKKKDGKKSKKSHKKKSKKSKRRSDSSASGSDSDGSADLDKLLAEKYKKVAGEGQEGVSIDKLLTMKYDKLTKELDMMGSGGSKGKRQRAREQSVDSSGSDRRGTRRRQDDRYGRLEEQGRRDDRDGGRANASKERSRDVRKSRRDSSEESVKDRKRDRKQTHSERDRSRDRQRNRSPVRSSHRSPVRKAAPSKEKHSRGPRTRPAPDDSDDERRVRKVRNFGLVTASGEKLDTSTRSEVRLYKREEIKAEQSKQRPTWSKPQEKKRPLSEKELEEKRLAMMSNAQWRDKERESNVKRYESEDHREDAKESREFDKEFLTKQLKRAAASETVESRIRSNRNNIQRSNGAMDRNFVKR